MNEEKEKKIDVWKIATIILIIICVLLLIYNISETYYKFDNSKSICNKIKNEGIGTPAWIDSDGNIIKLNNNGTIIQLGYFPIIQFSIQDETEKEKYYSYLRDILEKNLIEGKISMIYNDNCGWCKKEIYELKEIGFWDEYVSSGLTIDCTEVN